MLLHYTFEICCGRNPSYEYYDREEPPYEEIIGVDFDYEVEPTTQDLAEFLECEHNEEILDKVLSMLGGVLEEDNGFIRFMKHQYRNKAYKECEEVYEIH